MIWRNLNKYERYKLLKAMKINALYFTLLGVVFAGSLSVFRHFLSSEWDVSLTVITSIPFAVALLNLAVYLLLRKRS